MHHQNALFIFPVRLQSQENNFASRASYLKSASQNSLPSKVLVATHHHSQALSLLLSKGQGDIASIQLLNLFPLSVLTLHLLSPPSLFPKAFNDGSLRIHLKPTNEPNLALPLLPSKRAHTQRRIRRPPPSPRASILRPPHPPTQHKNHQQELLRMVLLAPPARGRRRVK